MIVSKTVNLYFTSIVIVTQDMKIPVKNNLLTFGQKQKIKLKTFYIFKSLYSLNIANTKCMVILKVL